MTWVDDLWAGFSDSDREKIMLTALDGFFNADSELASMRLSQFVDDEKFHKDPKMKALLGELVVLFQQEAEENPNFETGDIIQLRDYQGD